MVSLGVVSVIAIGLVAFLAFQNRQREIPEATARGAAPIIAATYVGATSCKNCHEAAYNAWRGSHHELAMQQANEHTVLGSFADAKLSYAGVTSTFFKRDGKFFVNTDGPDGELKDYEIKYTFGVTPLQQYLIEMPGVRLQALSVAWDTRSKEQGGQRWFHLYPKERITHNDELHWTRPAQNWNFMCADCHSTNLRKNYDQPLIALILNGQRSASVARPAMAPARSTLNGRNPNPPLWKRGDRGDLKSLRKSPLVPLF